MEFAWSMSHYYLYVQIVSNLTGTRQSLEGQGQQQ